VTRLKASALFRLVLFVAQVWVTNCIRNLTVIQSAEKIRNGIFALLFDCTISRLLHYSVTSKIEIVIKIIRHIISIVIKYVNKQNR
jgi:hypothetical protein